MVWIGVLLGLALGIAPLQGKPSGDNKDGKPLKDAKGKEYRLIEGEFTWDEAGKACWSGGRRYPASLTNDEFDEIAGKVENLLSGSTCAETWVGLTRDGDIWYWYSGSGDDRKTSSTDKRWAAGEPRNEKSADVAFIGADRQGGKKGHLMSAERKSKRCSVLCDKWGGNLKRNFCIRIVQTNWNANRKMKSAVTLPTLSLSFLVKLQRIQPTTS